MAKKRKAEPTQEEQKYVPRKTEYIIFIGEKYYRRLQPVPYSYKKVNVKQKLGLE